MRRIRILLVDDEPFMLDVLKYIVNWTANGFEIVGEACDGEKALEMIKSREIDILLTDLKMPVMGGLELIQNVKAEHPTVRFIVLSSSDEFHMVSDAFKLGADEYLLKSEMTAGQVLKAITSMRGKVEAEDKRISEKAEQKKLEQEAFLKNQKLMAYIDKNHEVIKEKVLKEIFWGTNPVSVAQLSNLEEHGIRLDASRKKVMVIQVDDYVRLEQEVWNGDGVHLNYTILSLIDEVLNNYSIGDVFRNSPGQYVIVCCFKGLLSEKAMEALVMQIYSTIMQNIKQHLHVVCTMWGCSETVNGFDALKNLFSNALTASDYYFVKGKGKIIHWAELPCGEPGVSGQLSGKFESFKEFLKYTVQDTATDPVEKFQIDGSSVLPSEVGAIREIFYRYYVYLKDYSEANQLMQALGDNFNRFTCYLKDYGTLSDLNAWMKDIIRAIGAVAGESSSLVKRVKRVVHKRYMDAISLSDIAEELGNSAGYISKVFSRQEGISVTDYITKVRMEVAINYMSHTTLRVYEIAEKVGYNNVEHFSRTFKKIMGKSPKEYSG